MKGALTWMELVIVLGFTVNAFRGKLAECTALIALATYIHLLSKQWRKP